MSRRRSTRKLESVPRPPNLRSPAARAGPPAPTHPRVSKRLERLRVPGAKLCWRCGRRVFGVRSTKDVKDGKPSRSFFGQERALETLRMGLAMGGLGYNVFVCGLGGTNKITRLTDYLRTVAPRRGPVPDRLYVQNFSDPRRPKLLELPAGKGDRFQSEIHQLLNRLH